jgi:hypothetical protein
MLKPFGMGYEKRNAMRKKGGHFSYSENKNAV